MTRSEADTRANLIDPVLYQRGWTEAHVKREETRGPLEIVGGRAVRRTPVRLDYTLRVRVGDGTQPVAVGLLEAKVEGRPPDHGLEQAKRYGRLLNVPFCFSTNGHYFVEFDRFGQVTSEPRPFGEFPSPDDLRARYEASQGFSLSDPNASPLLVRYPGGEDCRRYYQDGAIRAVLEKIARGDKKALLSLATGTGKTRIAVYLLWRLIKAGQLRKALFVCDRDELREQASRAFRAVFSDDAAVVSVGKDQHNARILIATYQTLGVIGAERDETFLTKHYAPDFFSHIIIDECHRSAWGEWKMVLDRNPNAVHIGLTATPRQIQVIDAKGAEEDERLIRDNIRYFGEPVYVYTVSDGMDDGYLAACEIVRKDVYLGDKEAGERETGVERGDLIGKQLTDVETRQPVSVFEAQEHYMATSFEDRLVMPDRVHEMCRNLFGELVKTGGPLQKTIIFCARDSHAQAVASTMGNLYAAWCKANGQTPAEPYAFKCTAQAGNADVTLKHFRELERSYFVATTVDLLTTGVDVPVVRNVVFFKYVRSPIAFYQMVGRGTRIDIPHDKLMFRVYDYTDATQLFGEDFITRVVGAKKREPFHGPCPDPRPKERRIEAVGFEVFLNDAGRFILIDGQPVTLEEYQQRLAARLVEEVPTLEEFRRQWEDSVERKGLLERLPDGVRSALLIQNQTGMKEYDLYDVLADLAYGLAPRTRAERARDFALKPANATWLASLPAGARVVLQELAEQYATGGTEALETPAVFETPAVKKAGGFDALRVLGRVGDVLRETKRRLFAA